jgi:tRNA G18 (ribose-2'-O)-methylase SpoU
MRLNLLLWDVESDMNLGLAIRDCYMLGNGLVHLKVYDPRKVMKMKSYTIQRFSSYTLDHYKDIEVFEDIDAAIQYLETYENRVICTSPEEETAADINHFEFKNNDLLVFGNEFHGIPDEALRYATERVIIPMYGSVYDRPDLGGKVRNVGVQRCHGLSTVVSLCLFLAVDGLTGFKDWRNTFRTPRIF